MRQCRVVLLLSQLRDESVVLAAELRIVEHQANADHRQQESYEYRRPCHPPRTEASYYKVAFGVFLAMRFGGDGLHQPLACALRRLRTSGGKREERGIGTKRFQFAPALATASEM
jgi:hypothetical protein